MAFVGTNLDTGRQFLVLVSEGNPPAADVARREHPGDPWSDPVRLCEATL